MKYGVWVNHIPETAADRFGSALVLLAQQSRKGVPIAPSFAIDTQGMQSFFTQPSLQKAISTILKGSATKRASLIAKDALAIQKTILKAEFPRELHRQIAQFMDKLEEAVLHKSGDKLSIEIVLYDTNGAQLVPPLWVQTKQWSDVAQAITRLLASLFTPDLLASRIRYGLPIVPSIAGMSIRYAPEAHYSGSAQCYNEQTHDGESIVVEVASGHAKTSLNDRYVFDKKTLTMLHQHKHASHTAKNASGRHHRKSFVQDDEQALALRVANLAKTVQTDELNILKIHWSLQAQMLVITHIEYIDELAAVAQSARTEVSPTILLRGVPCVPGRVTGRVRLMQADSDVSTLALGDIAVVSNLTKKDMVWLKNVSGVITETGTSATQEAAFAIEAGIVAMSATHAKVLLREGQMITMDGYRGEVHAGKISLSVPTVTVPHSLTGTKLLTIVEDPLHVQREQLMQIDGVGLLRGEFLLNLTGLRPHEVREKKLTDEYREIVGEVIERAARLAYPLPLSYQLHDLTEETGNRHRHEPNPKLGYRGSHRIIQEPELLAVELAVLADLYHKGLENIRILMPSIRTIAEVTTLRDLVKAAWPSHEKLPELWVRCSAPALLIQAETLVETGIDGVLFDIPVLSELLHGFDGDNHQVGHHLIHDHDALLDALHYAIAVCRSEGIATGIIAEGYEMQVKVLEEAVEAGIQEVVATTRELPVLRDILASIEQRVILDHARNHEDRQESDY